MRRLDLLWCAKCRVVTARPAGQADPIPKDATCQACGTKELHPLLIFKTGPKEASAPCQAYGVE